MNAEEIKAKMENIEDPEVKKIVEELNAFITPKFQEFQTMLGDKKVGMLKMIKMAKEFTSNLQTEYEAKYGRKLEEDMRKANEYFGFNQMDMLSMLNNAKL